MKKFFLFLFILLLLAVAAAFVIHTRYPETEAGARVQVVWDWTQAKYGLAKEWTVERWNASFGGKSAGEKPAERGAETAPEAPERTEPQPDAPAELAGPAPAKAAPVRKIEEPTPAKKEGWQGLEPDNRISGRRLSAADLKGKVVLVYAFDASSERSLLMLPRVQQIYSSFKHHPFLVIGSVPADEAKEVATALKSRRDVTFPVYADAEPSPGRITGVKRGRPYFLVIDSRGKLVFRGVGDPEATEAIVNAIGEAAR